MNSQKCKACNKSFGRTERRTVLGNDLYHQTCLSCISCKQPLMGAFFPIEEGLQCEECHGRISNRCLRCGDVIRAGFPFKVLKGHHYHEDCLICCSCGKILNPSNGNIFEKENYPQCAQCYHSQDPRLVNVNYGPASHDTRRLQECAKCKRQINRSSVFYTYEDVAFHKECFVCNRCGVNLVGKTCHRLASAIVCPNCN